MQNTPVHALIALVVAAAGLTIGQIWGPLMGWDTYFKVLGTMGIIFLVIGLVVIIKSDLGQHKKLKDENYLD